MKYFLFTLALLFSLLSRADAWDNLTLEEAEVIVAELEANPYIFGYCDCCDNEEDHVFIVNLKKVISTEIVTCSWNSDLYAVEYKAEELAEIMYDDDASGFKVSPPNLADDVDNTIYMNYTWSLHKTRKLASPLFNIVSYTYYGDDPRACKDEFSYPTPKELAPVYKGKDYKKWYKKNAK